MKNKKFIILLTSIIISLGIYNLILFLIKSSSGSLYNASFWVSYGFITLAFILFFVSQFIVGSKENLDKVTGMPINVLSFMYLFVAFIMGTIFMFFPASSLIIVLIPHIIIFAIYLLIFIPALLTYYVKD